MKLVLLVLHVPILVLNVLLLLITVHLVLLLLTEFLKPTVPVLMDIMIIARIAHLVITLVPPV